MKQEFQWEIGGKKMNRCPWCGSKAKVKNSPLGYFCECSVNGHIHNIGCLVYGSLAFSETENEAKELWDKETNKMKR